MIYSTALALVLCALGAAVRAENIPDGASCKPEGLIQCNDNGQTWSMCGSGYMQFEGNVPAGMQCTQGQGIVVSQDVKAAAAGDAFAGTQLVQSQFAALLAGKLDLSQAALIADGQGFNFSIVPKKKKQAAPKASSATSKATTLKTSVASKAAAAPVTTKPRSVVSTSVKHTSSAPPAAKTVGVTVAVTVTAKATATKVARRDEDETLDWDNEEHELDSRDDESLVCAVFCQASHCFQYCM